jgi:putative nucleotidyltransferase with HDIG domain
MFVKYIRDPVHGYIGMTDVEMQIMDTLPVQRLRGIKQLSVAHLTYPGALHSRFSHSLGVMHLAGQMAESLRRSAVISDEDWQLIRLAGLLHDIGHGPFSHSYEEILLKHRKMNHEDLGVQIIEGSELADVIKNCGFSPGEIISIIKGSGRKEGYLHQIVSSQVDADKMDFLLRDSYFTGAEYGRIDVNRLIQAMGVMDDEIAVDLKALFALEAFMIARYEMFLAVYYHHSVRAADILLRKAMEYGNELIGLTTFIGVDEFLRLDDSYVVTRLRELDPKKFNSHERELAYKAREMMRRLDRRELLKAAYQRDVYVKDEYVAKLLSDEEVRHQKEREIAQKAGVDPEQVVVDVPTLDSIPYYPREIDPMEVPVFRVASDGGKEPARLSNYSRLINVLKGYVDIIRVYTQPNYRSQVERAAIEVFKTLPLSAQISM